MLLKVAKKNNFDLDSAGMKENANLLGASFKI